MAVTEEHTAGGRVVTTPTNGAAGEVPVVIRYYRGHCIGTTHAGMHTFLLTVIAIGGLITHNASISRAEIGCQGEVVMRQRWRRQGCVPHWTIPTNR